MKRNFLLLLMLALWLVHLNAQTVPQGVNYQTIVRGMDNHPVVNAEVSLRFQLKDVNGALLYEEVQKDTTNNHGLVNLIVGTGAPLNFQNIDWSAGPKTLTIAYETSPGIFDDLGTMQLMSVPYAFYAAKSNEASVAGNLVDLGAQVGQVLQWNGNTWVPMTLPTDTDTDPSNELQNLLLTGNQLSLSNGGGMVTLPVEVDGSITNEIQALSLSGNQLSLSNGGGIVVLPTGTTYTAGSGISISGLDQISATDPSITNEIQALSLSGNQLSLSNGGGMVVLPTGTTYTAGSGISISGSNQISATDVSNTNEIQTLSLAGNQITLSNGGGMVNLPAEVDGSITNEIQALSISGNQLSLSNGGGMVTLPAEVDGSITNEIQALSISGNQLSLSNGGGMVTLPAEVDGSITNEIQALSISGNQLTLSIGGGMVTLPPATGDNWGTQSAMVGAALTGNGTAATPLNVATDGITTTHLLDGTVATADLADNAVTNAKMADNAVNTAELANGAVTAAKLNQMSATTDQVLRWNGTAWAPTTLPPATGDNWGAQSAQVGAALAGNGTLATPLNVATGGITTTHLLDGTVATIDLADNAVTNAKMADNAVNTAELANGAVTAPKLNQMSATTDQVLRWNGTAWAPATFAYTTCGRVNSPDGQERIMVSNQSLCPSGAQLEVNTTLAEGVDLKVAGAGDVKGARVEATGGSGSNDGIILFSRSDNNEATGINLATGRNGNTTDAVGLRVLSGFSANNMDDINYDFNDGNSSDQNYGIHTAIPDIVSNNSELYNNFGRNRDIGIYVSTPNLNDWTAYFDGNMYAINTYVEDQLHVLNYSTQNNVNADWRIDVINNAAWQYGLSFFYNNNATNATPKSYIDEVNGNYMQPSDRRLKEEIMPLQATLSKVMSLNPVSYIFKEDEKRSKNVGFVSQEVNNVFPEFTKKVLLENGSDVLMVNYAGFSVIAIKAIQEQQQIIEAQHAKLEKQEDRLTKLEKEMAELKALFIASAPEKSGKK